MMSYFLLGDISIADTAKKALGRTPLDLLARHAIHDHGIVTPDEIRANVVNSLEGGEIVSRYRVDPTQPKSRTVVVKTHEGWGRTTIALEKKS